MRTIWTAVAAAGLCLVTLSIRVEPARNGRASVPPADGLGVPERPRRTVDVGDVKSEGRTIHVPKGGDFQAALDSAVPGDAIVLDPGVFYEGPFVLPRKSGAGWIV